MIYLHSYSSVCLMILSKVTHNPPLGHGKGSLSNVARWKESLSLSISHTYVSKHAHKNAKTQHADLINVLAVLLTAYLILFVKYVV